MIANIVGKPPLSVLVVDDSPLVRRAFGVVLSREPDLAVTVAHDALVALEMMRRNRPDVVVLDLEMPRMDGLTFLRRVMTESPLPVVVCSSLLGSSEQAALEALREGAVEVVAKPRVAGRAALEESAVFIADAIRAAAQARTQVRQPTGLHPVPAQARPMARSLTRASSFVAVGASTGGTEALRVLLRALPADGPALAIVQHMPAGFTAAFARGLDAACAVRVKEAATGDVLCRGQALIAPGNRHLRVVRRADGFVAEVSDGPAVSRHRPSVDVLFRSAASAGAEAAGVLMTGMGNDGAAGLMEMRRAGALTLAQDEASCVVYGMPRAAVELGAAQRSVSLSGLAGALLAWERHRGKQEAP